MNIKHTTTWPQRRWQYCTVCIFMYFCWPKWLQNFLFTMTDSIWVFIYFFRCPKILGNRRGSRGFLRGSEVSGRPWFVGETTVGFVGCWYVVTFFFLFLTGIVTNKRPSQEMRHFTFQWRIFDLESDGSHLACQNTWNHVWRNPWRKPLIWMGFFPSEVILEGLGKWTNSQLCKHTSVGGCSVWCFFPSGCWLLMRLLIWFFLFGNNTPRCPRCPKCVLFFISERCWDSLFSIPAILELPLFQEKIHLYNPIYT